MNCDKAERLVLLEHAGELSSRARRRLGDHLARCARCRALREDLDRVRQAVAASNLAAGPAPAVLRRIMTEAATPRPGRGPLPFQVVLRPALAAAAGVALAAGLSVFFALRHMPSADQASTAYNRMAELAGMLAAIMDRDTEAAGNVRETPGTVDIRTIARQLLILEGLTVEIPGETSEPEVIDAERQPTTLQWRSSPAVSSAECA